MNTSLLITGQLLSLLAKVTVSAVLLTTHLRTRRESALIWALAWLVAAFSIVADALGALPLVSLTEATFSFLLFLGALQYLSEEVGKKIEYQLIWATPPLIAAMYGILLGEDWFSIVGIPYGIAAFFVILSGVMISISAGRGFRNGRKTAVALSLLGIHKMNYPFLRGVVWFAPIGFSIGALLTVLSAYFMSKMVLSEEFIKLEGPLRLNIKPGIEIISAEGYRKLKEELNGYPVLAFIRELTPPERWNAYFLTSIPGENTIPPTHLPKILELSARYLRESNAKGLIGVIVLDGVEYLIIHNGITAVTKFAGALRDITLLRKGRLVVVLEESALDRKDYLTIKRVLAGG